MVNIILNRDCQLCGALVVAVLHLSLEAHTLPCMHPEGGRTPSRRTVLRGALLGAAFLVVPRSAHTETATEMWDKKMSELSSWRVFCDTVDSLLDDKAVMRTAGSYHAEVSKEIAFLRSAVTDAITGIVTFRILGGGSSPSSGPLLQKEQEVRGKLHIADEAIKRFLQRSRDTSSTLSKFFNLLYGNLEVMRTVPNIKRA